MTMEETVSCPYCGEPVDIDVEDGVGAEQAYVEDCWVCCRPIAIVATPGEEGEPRVAARRLDD